MLKKSEILVGTREEIIDYFRNELNIHTNRDEAELNLFKELSIGKVVRFDMKTGVSSVEDQILKICDKEYQVGSVYWFEEEMISKHEFSITVRSVFVWVKMFTTEETEEMIHLKESKK